MVLTNYFTYARYRELIVLDQSCPNKFYRQGFSIWSGRHWSFKPSVKNIFQNQVIKKLLSKFILRKNLICWFHGPRIISAASNVVFWTFFRAKTCCVVCHAYCFCYGRTKMARKNVWKPHSIRLLRWFNFSQSGSRKNNRKAFEGASMEPTIMKLTLLITQNLKI